jgi:hypothetical protein
MPSTPASVQQADTISPLTFGAIGDAYGFCFEFASADFVREHNNLR